jgi:Zn-dependent peptidase ImmA (M78 family)
VLGHTKIRHRAAPEKEESVKPIKRDDAAANRFAAALLAPYELSNFVHGMTAEQLATRFQISISAARIRLPVLERMYRRKHQISRPLPQAVVDFLKNHKGRSRG